MVMDIGASVSWVAEVASDDDVADERSAKLFILTQAEWW